MARRTNEIGLAVSFALTRFPKSLLFKVRGTDPVTFIVIALLLTMISLAACYSLRDEQQESICSLRSAMNN